MAKIGIVGLGDNALRGGYASSYGITVWGLGGNIFGCVSENACLMLVSKHYSGPIWLDKVDMKLPLTHGSLNSSTKRLQDRAKEVQKRHLRSVCATKRNLGILTSIEYIAPMLCKVAEHEYYMRRSRDQFFSKNLFFDPSWDMLLDLYINRIRGKKISVTSLSLASSVPSTTALRYIGELEKCGNIKRVESMHDARVTFLEITDYAFVAMSIILEEMLDKFEKESGARFVCGACE